MKPLRILALSAACIALTACHSRQTPPKSMSSQEMASEPMTTAMAQPPEGAAALAEAAPAQAPTKVEHVDAEQAKQLFDRKDAVVVLDVRTPKEYDSGHIPGALNYNFNAGDFAKKVSELDKSRPYLVHCAAGGRSTRSLEVFKQQGFQMIYHLDGGLSAWKNNGNPLVPSQVPSN